MSFSIKGGNSNNRGVQQTSKERVLKYQDAFQAFLSSFHRDIFEMFAGPRNSRSESDKRLMSDRR